MDDRLEKLERDTARVRRGVAERLVEAKGDLAAYQKAHRRRSCASWAACIRTPFIEKWNPPPYIADIIRLVAEGPPELRTIAIQKGSQVGMTSAFLAVVGYGIARQGKHVVIAQPTTDDARAFVRDSITPMMEATPELALLDLTTMRGRKAGAHRVYDRSSLYIFPGGTTARAWRRFVADTLLIDEVDALPPSIPGGLESEGEGDPLELARRPLRTRKGRLLVGGTPTASAGPSRIVRAVQDAERKFVWVVPCRHCGGETDIAWERITWPNKANPGHGCRRCGAESGWRSMRASLRRGRWVEAEQGEHWHQPLEGGIGIDELPAGTKSVAFALHSLYSPWTPWAEFVEQWLKATGNPNRQQVFVETVLAREWKSEREQAEAPALKAKQKPMPIPPEGARVCLWGVDVQKDYLVSLETYWSEPQRCWVAQRREHLGGIDDGRVGAWADLTDVINKRGHALPTVVCADIGYRQTDVIRALRQVSKATRLPTRHCRGVDGWRAQWFRLGKTATGLPMGLVGTYGIKQWILANLNNGNIAVSDALDYDALLELTSEHIEKRRRRGREMPVWVQTHANHAFDCLVYCSAVWTTMHRAAAA